MSNEALTWAFRQTAPSTGAKFVLVALADGANTENRCFPGQKKLMTMTGQGARSVVRHLAELESSGLIVRERRNVGYQKRLVDGFRLPVGIAVSVPSAPVDANSTGAVMTDANVAPTAQGANSTHAKSSEGHVPPRQNKRTQRDNPTTTSTTSEVVEIRQDVERVCSLLADLIEANGSKRPVVIDAWRTSARRLLDVDNRTEQQVSWLLNWCQQDTFWKANVLSMPTFREKFDRLRLAAQREFETRKSSNPWVG